MFTSVFIDDYCNFRKFKLNIPAKKENELNLNIIIGKNGSGKSCFLDALYCIAENNLVNKADQNVDNTKFDYEISLNNKIIIENPKNNNNNYLSEDEIEKHLWNKVLRLYTGTTGRRFNNEHNYNVLSLGPKEAKWALLTTFLAGQWTNPTPEESKLWEKVQKIALGSNPNINNDIKQIRPKIVWVDFADIIETREKSALTDDFLDWNLLCPSTYIPLEEGYRYFWNIDECTKLRENEIGESRISLFDILRNLIDLHREGKIFDTGFIYTQNDEELLPSEYLSDGEFGFLERFAVLMIARDIDKKSLILLDEPETHFNEYWKTWFLQLVCETLEGSNHDIFIATHSAMLLTDAKKNELLMIESAPDGVRQKDIHVSTYGANIIDIEKVLFQMEYDIGERAQNDIESIIKGKNTKTGKKLFQNNDDWKRELKILLKQVGPGEWRWRIRSKINQLEKADLCCNFAPNKGEQHEI